MKESAAITTMLVSHDQILRLGVQKTLAARKHIRFIAPSAGPIEMAEHMAREQPQVIIIDSQDERDLPGLIQHIKTLVPNGKTVLLLGLNETGWNRHTFSSGADAIILKMQPPAALIAYIETLCGLATDASQNTKPPHAQKSLQDGGRDAAPRTPQDLERAGSLTEREREILALMGHGLSNKDIADRLCISVITVRHHLTSIFDKLGVATRQKLLIQAHQYGLVEFCIPA
jgi:DNA-binding NarL/FixJ family response regulator